MIFSPYNRRYQMTFTSPDRSKMQVKRPIARLAIVDRDDDMQLLIF